jgi:RecA-family ATPase
MFNELPNELADLADQTPQAKRVAITKRLSQYETENVTWMWNPYLPNGKLVIIEGHPGLGKSTLTCEIASIATLGKMFPCGTINQPMDVLMLAVEDAPSDTIKPRVLASGGDVERIHFLEGIKWETETNDDTADLSSQLDIEAIRDAIRLHKVGLVIIDPLMAMIGGRKDAHKDQDVRQITTPLTKLAQDENVTIVCIRHLTKGGSTQAILRGSGSIGFAGSARVVVLVAKDPQDENKRVLATVKNNLAPIQASLSFQITNDLENKAGKIEWLGKSQFGADELLQTTNEDEKSALNEAIDFLLEELRLGAKSAKAITDTANNCNIADRTLKRAKKQLGVISEKSSSGFAEGWNWRLPNPHYRAEPLE